jgi:hypothetical protein
LPVPEEGTSEWAPTLMRREPRREEWFHLGQLSEAEFGRWPEAFGSHAFGWADTRLTMDQALQWDDFATPGEFEFCRERGFSMGEARRWKQISATLDIAAKWRDAGYEPQWVRRWREHISSGPDIAAAWDDAGFSREEAAAFGRLLDAAVAVEWRAAGLEGAWYDVVGSIDEAKAWADASFSVVEAGLWRPLFAAGQTGPSDPLLWPAEAARLRSPARRRPLG